MYGRVFELSRAQAVKLHRFPQLIRSAHNLGNLSQYSRIPRFHNWLLTCVVVVEVFSLSPNIFSTCVFNCSVYYTALIIRSRRQDTREYGAHFNPELSMILPPSLPPSLSCPSHVDLQTLNSELHSLEADYMEIQDNLFQLLCDKVMYIADRASPIVLQLSLLV